MRLAEDLQQRILTPAAVEQQHHYQHHHQHHYQHQPQEQEQVQEERNEGSFVGEDKPEIAVLEVSRVYFLVIWYI